MGVLEPTARRLRDRIRTRPAPPPVVSFGTGGSGTRAIAGILKAGGVYLGPKLNRASDALALEPFLRRWPAEYVRSTGWIDHGAARIDAADREMVDDLAAAVKRQRQGIPSSGARWGWKAPRTIFILPVVHEAFRDTYTIQLVRDGRDMAYSRNQNQLEALGPALLDDVEPDAPRPVRSITLWSRVNVAAATYGREVMEGRHLVVRYEDLCAEPNRTITRLLSHVDIDPDPVIAQANELVVPSLEIGRWRKQDPAELEAVSAAGAAGLSEFGYA
jgi:sulfur carrier protein ThiS